MDYYGRWKALMYYTKKFYAPQMISPHVDDAGTLNVYVVSDAPTAIPAEMILSIIDFEGKVISTSTRAISLEPIQGKSYYTESAAKVLDAADPKSVFLLAELKIGGKTVSQNEYFFRPFKELAASKPSIKTAISATAEGFRVMLSTDKLAKTIQLSGFASGFFSDNYFNLIPGRPVAVEFGTKEKMTVAEFEKKLRVRSLADAF
jgi:beta-mannosidase